MKTLNVFIKNGYNKNIEIPYATKVFELARYVRSSNGFIAAKINNEITSLSYTIKVNSEVEFITIEDTFGMEIYKRSLSFLLKKVAKESFKDKRLIIGHSLGPGYYFEFENYHITKDDLLILENGIKDLVNKKIPIERERISYKELLEYFKNNNYIDKYKLLLGINSSKLSIYKCDDFFELFVGPIVSNTSYLNVFSLIYYPPGFILQFPNRDNLKEVAPFVEQRKIFEIYKESKEQGKAWNVDNVGSLNELVLNNKIGNFIQVCEAWQSRKIGRIADEILKRKSQCKLVAIAGPSSSGKTTFSKRLSIELMSLGLKPFTISLDNYFVDREKTPLDENGRPDYETINALNLDLFNEQLNELFCGKKIKLPIYNFFTGRSSFSNDETSIGEDEIVVIEGIHCLNERLTHSIKKENKYKIYISALTQMNIDDNNRIPTTDNRILRRMVRDYKYRGHSAKKTFQMWPSVRNGEEKYIFPFQNDADGYFNSALDYELSVLKPYAEPLLNQIKPSDEEYNEAIRLLRFLSYFLNIDTKDIPSTSIIREFIGGSFFDY